MHMADALLSPAVGGAMYLASGAAVAYSTVKVKQNELGEKKLPLMAVAGAFVFAGQMINFTIPGTGSSGHIGGGILLAALLGGYPALLTIAAVLIIQSLFFADGGLLALGCNIFNMGVIPCLLVYPLIYKPIVRKGLSAGRIALASILSVVVGLQLGAFGVVLQTLASGVTALPFTTFTMLMQPIHLAIGIVEGLVTAAVLSFVYKARPEILESAATGHARQKKRACQGRHRGAAHPDGRDGRRAVLAGLVESRRAGMGDVQDSRHDRAGNRRRCLRQRCKGSGSDRLYARLRLCLSRRRRLADRDERGRACRRYADVRAGGPDRFCDLSGQKTKAVRLEKVMNITAAGPKRPAAVYTCSDMKQGRWEIRPISEAKYKRSIRSSSLPPVKALFTAVIRS